MTEFPGIEDLLPHRAPMILLDRVCAWNASTVECQVTVRDGAPFVEGGRVPAAVALEYMAQCAAVYAGLEAWRDGKPVRIGYLLGSRRVTLQVGAFAVGDELRVTATHAWGDDRLGYFDCRVERAGQEVAVGALNVYHGDRARAASR